MFSSSLKDNRRHAGTYHLAECACLDFSFVLDRVSTPCCAVFVQRFPVDFVRHDLPLCRQDNSRFSRPRVCTTSFEDMGRFSVAKVHYESITCTSVVLSYCHPPLRVLKVASWMNASSMKQRAVYKCFVLTVLSATSSSCHRPFPPPRPHLIPSVLFLSTQSTSLPSSLQILYPPLASFTPLFFRRQYFNPNVCRSCPASHIRPKPESEPALLGSCERFWFRGGC